MIILIIKICSYTEVLGLRWPRSRILLHTFYRNLQITFRTELQSEHHAVYY